MRKPYFIDESTIGAWVGAIYAACVLTFWIPIDIWLHKHHHEYITTEVRELFQSNKWEAVLFAGFVGAVLGVAFYHFFYQRNL